MDAMNASLSTLRPVDVPGLSDVDLASVRDALSHALRSEFNPAARARRARLWALQDAVTQEYRVRLSSAEHARHANAVKTARRRPELAPDPDLSARIREGLRRVEARLRVENPHADRLTIRRMAREVLDRDPLAVVA